jgi:hypothetical protein
MLETNRINPTVLYCATREQDLIEAEVSINSIRNIYPGIEIILYTSIESYQNNKINEIRVLDNARNDFSDKILAMKYIDRENVLFIDGDTFIVENCDDLFCLLTHFEMAIAHAPNRWTLKLENVPDSFPEFNTGVILFRKNELVKEFIDAWYEKFVRQLDARLKIASQDQVSFRELLYSSKIRFHVFTPEYNCRFNMGVGVSHRVKILHGRTRDFKFVAKDINSAALNAVGEPGIRWEKYPFEAYCEK